MPIATVIEYNRTKTVVIGPILSDTTGLPYTDSLLDTDIRLIKDGATDVAKNSTSNCTHTHGGYYRCPLSTTDTDNYGYLWVYTNKTGYTGGGVFLVCANNPYEALVEDQGSGVAADVTNIRTGADADIERGCDLALVARHLDHLFDQYYDPASPPGVSNSLLNIMIESDVGVPRWTANALEQGPGGSAPSAADIADAVWDEDAGLHQTQDSFGQAIGDPDGDISTIWSLCNWALNARVGDVETDIANLNDLSTADIDARLAAIHLDHLLDTDTPSPLPGTAGSILHDVLSDNAGAWRLNVNVAEISDDSVAADNLENVFDNSTWVTNFIDMYDGTGYAGGSNNLEVDVQRWNDAAVIEINQQIAEAVWDRDATLHQDQGTFGQAIGDPGLDISTIWNLCNTYLDAAVSSRGTADPGDEMNLADGAITAAKFATDAITADVIAPNAIGSSEFAQSAAEEVAFEVWTELVAGYSGTTNFGGLVVTYLDAAVSSVGDAATVADAVWNEGSSGHTDAGKAGQQLWTDIDAILSDTTTLLSRLTADRANKLDTVAEVGDAMDLVNDAIDSAVLHVSAIDEIWEYGTASITSTSSIGYHIHTNLAVPGDEMNLADGAIASAKFAAGAITTAAFAAGAIDANAIGTDAIDAGALATGAANEIRDAILSDSIAFAGADVGTIEGKITKLSDAALDALNRFQSTMLASGSVSTVTDNGDFTTSVTGFGDNELNNTIVMFYTGNNLGPRFGVVATYTSSNGRFQMNDPFPNTVVSGDDFYVVAGL